MSAWTLDWSNSNDTLGWRTIATKPSCDACKAEAKGYHKLGLYGAFRIYDDLGRLYKCTVTREGGGWRSRGGRVR